MGLQYVALWAVAQWASAKAAWISCAAVIVGNGLIWLLMIKGNSWVLAMIFFGVIYASVTVISVFIGTRRRYEEALLNEARLLRVERDQQAKIAVADERSRIAREMHDIVAHSLSVMVTLAEGAHLQFDKNPESADRAIQQVAKTGRTAISDMRRMLAVLRGEEDSGGGSALELAPQPGLGDLPGLIETYRQAGLPIDLRVDDDLPADSGLGLTIYRIVQESLTNVLRYGPDSKQVVVDVRLVNGMVGVDVANSGASQHAAGKRDWHSSGQGLLGMAERVKLFGGEVQAGPANSGWRVHATLNPARKTSVEDSGVQNAG
jgi:signal transduction histidine kinase